MKLNMIVVITMWLPRLACSTPGIQAQKAPIAMEARMASGMRMGQGRNSRPRPTVAAPTPAI